MTLAKKKKKNGAGYLQHLEYFKQAVDFHAPRGWQNMEQGWPFYRSLVVKSLCESMWVSFWADGLHREQYAYR